MTQEEAFGQALWVGGNPVWKAPCFASAFDLPSNARIGIHICGLGSFRLFINGKSVSDDLFAPAYTDYAPRDITVDGVPFDEQMRHRCCFMQYDLTPFVRRGRNILAVSLIPGYFAQDMPSFNKRVCYGQPRLIWHMTWTCEDGQAGVLDSGEETRVHDGDVTECQFFKGETLDLRRLPEDWTTADTSEWEHARLLAPLDTCFEEQSCPTDRVIRIIKPRLVASFPAAKVYDAGENTVGFVVFKDKETAGGRVDVRFSEAPDACGAPEPRYGHDQRFSVVSDGKGRMVRPRTTWFGFRYFAVSGRAQVLHVEVVHADVRVTSAFSCGQPVLDWLYAAFTRTQLCNLHMGIPTDCPHIERKGYTGDGQLVCQSALMTLDYAPFLNKWMRDILDCQDSITGHVQYTAPYTKNGGGPGGWGCAIAVVPWQYYRYTGDLSALKNAYDGMKRYASYLRMHSENGLVTSDRADAWCLGDWCAPGGSRLARPFVNTYFLVKTLEIILRTGQALGMPDGSEWSECLNEARHKMTDAFFDRATGDFADGIEGANAYALDAGLGNKDTLAHLVSHYQAFGGYDTGIFGTEIVTRVLFDKGYPELAYRLLTSENPASFAGWMRAGATTLWEYWPGDSQRSLNHPMFGAVTKELFHRVLGISQPEYGAGWTEATIKPVLTHVLPSASGHITTPRGIISVSYQTIEDTLCIRITLPQGVHGTLRFHGTENALDQQNEFILRALNS